MKLYRIQYEGGYSHVEAEDFAQAVHLWRAWIVKEFGPDSGWDDGSDPESVTIVDDSAVIRDPRKL